MPTFWLKKTLFLCSFVLKKFCLWTYKFVNIWFKQLILAIFDHVLGTKNERIEKYCRIGSYWSLFSNILCLKAGIANRVFIICFHKQWKMSWETDSISKISYFWDNLNPVRQVMMSLESWFLNEKACMANLCIFYKIDHRSGTKEKYILKVTRIEVYKVSFLKIFY